MHQPHSPTRTTHWTTRNIPSLHGTTALVTGANSGIGFQTARILAQRGAHVVLACRNPHKSNHAADLILAQHPKASVATLPLDLADLNSIAACADQFCQHHHQLHLLVLNAGIMMPPYTLTKQGYESQFATNHLGHYALTGHLIDLLTATKKARVTTVASNAARVATINFDDPNYRTRRYQKWGAYCQSKLANLMFTVEFQRRCQHHQLDVTATAAHPGWSATNLQEHDVLVRYLAPRMAMTAEQGAYPTLRAATEPYAQPAAYYGPPGFFSLRGNPVPINITPLALAPQPASKLWDLSATLTGVNYLN